MAFQHGRHTKITLGGDDLSPYTNTSELGTGADSHDVTTYGKAAHVFEGGLKTGTASMSGIYDNTAGTGPRAVIRPLVGTTAELVRMPEGEGTGKPVDTCDVVVTNYVETSPVADMVTWSCEMQISDVVVESVQEVP